METECESEEVGELGKHGNTENMRHVESPNVKKDKKTTRSKILYKEYSITHDGRTSIR
jgi:hypothetical protein